MVRKIYNSAGWPAIVGQIVSALSGLGEVQTEDVVVATESIQFGLPKELRQQAAGLD